MIWSSVCGLEGVCRIWSSFLRFGGCLYDLVQYLMVPRPVLVEKAPQFGFGVADDVWKLCEDFCSPGFDFWLLGHVRFFVGCPEKLEYLPT